MSQPWLASAPGVWAGSAMRPDHGVGRSVRKTGGVVPSLSYGLGLLVLLISFLPRLYFQNGVIRFSQILGQASFIIHDDRSASRHSDLRRLLVERVSALFCLLHIALQQRQSQF